MVVKFLEEAGGDVGGGDGDDAFDGNDEAFVAVYALDVAFGALKDSAGDADALAFLEVDGFGVQVFEVGVAAGGHHLESVHLAVGNDGRVLGAAVPVKDDMSFEFLLDCLGLRDRAVEKDERADGGFLHHRELAMMLMLHELGRVVAFDRDPLQLGFSPKNLVEENLQGKPVQCVRVQCA